MVKNYPILKKLVSLFFLLFSFVAFSQTQTQTFITSGTFTVPCDVTSITVEAWGGGGGGQRAEGFPSAGGGGSGSGYVKTTITVIAGNNYNYFVGSGGSGNSGVNGTATWFINNTTLNAVGGVGAGAAITANNTWGTGATAPNAGNVGGTIINSYGGSGGNAGNNFSGGGGSSGGSTASNNASGITGGAAPTDGYAGANGRNTNGVSANGNIGAGGAGGRTSVGTNQSGGSGGNGQIRITYTSTFQTYCSPTFTSGVEPITNVTFAGINNPTINTLGGSSLESFCLTGTVVRGTTHQISLKGNTDGNFSDFFRVYVDWDQDGAFGNNANEIYDIGTITFSDGTDKILIGDIAVPATAILGNTKMRVMKNYGAYSTSACQTGSGWGQAEDYTINVTSPTDTYCTSYGNNTDGYKTGIRLVNFNTINNATPIEDNDYSNFTAISTSVTRGLSYNLTVNVNTDGNYTNYTYAWIDWNQDGDFLDAGESYNLGTATNVSNGATSLSPLPITIPATASVGSIRMRVSTRYNTNPSSCGGGFDGEVEDYTIIIPSTIDFSGTTNDYIDFGDNHDLTSSFSIEAWVIQNVSVVTGTIISKRDALSTNKRGYHLVLNNGKPNLTWYNNIGAGTTLINIESLNAITNNKWYHIAATYDGTTAKLYVDGVLVASGTTATPPTNGTEKFLIGAMYDSNTPTTPKNNFNGYIDEVRVWDVVLSAQQLREMMNQEIVQNGTAVKGKVLPLDISGGLLWINLKGYYPMNDDTANDKSGNAVKINGSPKNMTTSQPQTAPLPYKSTSNGNWETAATWLNNSVQNLPNSTGIDTSTKIDWNIVETSHNVNNTTGHTVLGLLINGASKLVIKASDSLRVTHYLKLDGILDLEGESQLLQDQGSVLDVASGSGYLERDQQGTSDNFRYNYWGSPVNTTGTAYTIAGVLRDGTDPNDIKNINFGAPYAYADGIASIPPASILLSTYWMYKYANLGNGYSGWTSVGKDGTLKVGEGFTMKGSNTNLAEQNYTFAGKPNNGDITLPIAANRDYLIGNPYPSAIDAKEFIRDNISAPSGNRTVNVIDGNLYFWDHFGGGTHLLKSYEGGYGIFNLTGFVKAMATDALINNTGNQSTKIPPRFIPVAQGFFVTSVSGIVGTENIQFKNSQRLYKKESPAVSQFMKSAKSSKSNKETVNEDVFPKIYLKYSSPKGFHRQLLVGFIENTNDGVDIGYDAINYETFEEDMYWRTNNINFIIQAVPTLNDERILPLEVKVATAGIIKISLDNAENIPGDTEIFIKDYTTGKMHNISKTPFEIEIMAGKYADRFALTFKTQKLMAEDVKAEILISAAAQPIIEGIHVFMNNAIGELQIKNNSTEEIISVALINSLGQTVKTWNSNFNIRTISLPINTATGIYVVQINMKKGSVVQKVVVK